MQQHAAVCSSSRPLPLLPPPPTAPPTCNRSRCPKEQQPLPPNWQHFARVQRIEEQFN